MVCNDLVHVQKGRRNQGHRRLENCKKANACLDDRSGYLLQSFFCSQF